METNDKLQENSVEYWKQKYEELFKKSIKKEIIDTLDLDYEFKKAYDMEYTREYIKNKQYLYAFDNISKEKCQNAINKYGYDLIIEVLQEKLMEYEKLEAQEESGVEEENE